MSDTLILASTSPRRRELLQRLSVQFHAVSPEPDDDPADHRPAVQFAQDLAARKAASVALAPEYASRFVLGADTVVFDDEQILLKPADRGEARRMLERLAGRTHRVVTGLALYGPAAGDGAPDSGGPGGGGGPESRGGGPESRGGGRSPRVEAEITAVTFAPLDREEIEWYLDSGEWRGVAGGYRIQERGAVLVEHIAGSYSGVMGLPLRLLYSMLRVTGFRFPVHR